MATKQTVFPPRNRVTPENAPKDVKTSVLHVRKKPPVQEAGPEDGTPPSSSLPDSLKGPNKAKE